MLPRLGMAQYAMAVPSRAVSSKEMTRPGYKMPVERCGVGKIYSRTYLERAALPFGWADFPPSVNRLIGLQWLARILYPDAFAEDLRTLTRDFYAR